MGQLTKTIIIVVNKTPPSLLTTITNLVKCNKIALVVVPKKIIEPNKVILEIELKQSQLIQ
jgi:hypothetical protein